MLAEEGLTAQGMPALMSILAGQPPWSDIPIVVLTSSGDMSEARLHSLNAFAPSGNVTFLERPFRQMTLISTLKMAMRARERQYQLRGTLSNLGESEERLRLALDSGKIGAWEWNVKINRLVGSPRLHEFLGLPDGTLQGGLDALIAMIHPEDSTAFRQAVEWALESGSDCEMEFRALRPDGGTRWLYTRAKVFRDRENRPARVIGAAMDISERKQVEEDLRKGKETLLQSQKMEAIGKLAGGIAHDFNNMLTAINGYSELLLGQLNDKAALNAGLGEILRSGRRAAALTNQLLAYSRQQLMAFQVVDMNAVVEGMYGLLQRLLNEDIRHVLRLKARIPNIKADPSQMEQVVLNLALNARDAMPGGGQLSIETCALSLGKEGFARYGGAPPGEYVCLRVKDTGVGMSEAVKTHIFEPFFTTKSLGKGTGHGTFHGLRDRAAIRGLHHRGYGPGARIGVRSDLPRRGRARGGPDFAVRAEGAEGAPPGHHPHRRRRGFGALLSGPGAEATGLHGALGDQRRGGAGSGHGLLRRHPSAHHRRGDAGNGGPRTRGASFPGTAFDATAFHLGIHGRRRTATWRAGSRNRLHEQTLSARVLAGKGAQPAFGHGGLARAFSGIESAPRE